MLNAHQFMLQSWYLKEKGVSFHSQYCNLINCLLRFRKCLTRKCLSSSNTSIEILSYQNEGKLQNGTPASVQLQFNKLRAVITVLILYSMYISTCLCLISGPFSYKLVIKLPIRVVCHRLHLQSRCHGI